MRKMRCILLAGSKRYRVAETNMSNVGLIISSQELL